MQNASIKKLKSPLKDLPCEKIIAEFRISVDKYCTGKITQEEMIASIPDLQDTKVRSVSITSFRRNWIKLMPN